MTLRLAYGLVAQYFMVLLNDKKDLETWIALNDPSTLSIVSPRAGGDVDSYVVT